MSIFDTLEKRHHVVKYKPEIVPDKTLKDLLILLFKESSINTFS